jgi:hypothetical protein
MDEWVEINIHDTLAMRVARGAAAADRFQETFSPFLTSGLPYHDMTIGEEIEPLPTAARIKRQYRYTSSALHNLREGWQIRVDESGYHVRGEGDLLPVALPLIDSLLVRRGMAMVHAGAVECRGRGVCLAATGGTGKTSSVAKLARLEGASFMSDDLALLSRDKRLLGLAKRILLHSHHQDIFGDAFRKTRQSPLPYRLSQTISPLARPFMKRYPSLRGWARRWSPVLMVVPVAPAAALAGVEVSSSSALNLVMLMEAYDGSSPELSEPKKSWLVSRMVGQFYADILDESQSVISALASTGLLPLDEALREKAEVLRCALEGVPAYLLRLPANLSRDETSDVVVEQVLSVLGTRSATPG